MIFSGRLSIARCRFDDQMEMYEAGQHEFMDDHFFESTGLPHWPSSFSGDSAGSGSEDLHYRCTPWPLHI